MFNWMSFDKLKFEAEVAGNEAKYYMHWMDCARTVAGAESYEQRVVDEARKAFSFAGLLIDRYDWEHPDGGFRLT